MSEIQLKDLCVSVEDKSILKGVNLDVNPGELHVIMGPNGSGKSTLANTIAGHPKYEINSGDMIYRGESINEMSAEERSCRGIFMSFQYPIGIPGVKNIYFLKAAVNALRKHSGKNEIDSAKFLKSIREKLGSVGLDESFLHRSVNEGFSGGEKKRNEILQMITLEPKLSVLDETDSGLDIDALKIVADGINSYRNDERSFILITHYQRMLNFLEPDKIHVLLDGKIVSSGDIGLAHELEKKGYSWLREKVSSE